MADNKQFYENFYNGNEEFKANFPSMDAFEGYVDGNSDVLSHLEDIYPLTAKPTIDPIEDPVKKKDGSTSILNLGGSPIEPPRTFENSPYMGEEDQNPEYKLGDLFKSKKKVKVETPFENVDPYEAFKINSDKFNQSSNKFNEEVSVKSADEVIGNTLSAIPEAIKNVTEGALGLIGSMNKTNAIGPLALTASQGLGQLQRQETVSDKKLRDASLVPNADETAFQKNAEYLLRGNAEKTYVEEDRPGLYTIQKDFIDGKEVELGKQYNEKEIMSLSMPKSVAAALPGEKEVEYDLIPNIEKVEKYATDLYLPAMGYSEIQIQKMTPEKLLEIKATPSFMKFLNVTKSTVEDGILSIQIQKEVDSEAKKLYNNIPEVQKNGISGLGEAVTSVVIPKIKMSQQIIQSRSDKAYNQIMTDYTSAVDLINTGMEQVLFNFQQKFNYNPETNQFMVRDEAEFNLLQAEQQDLLNLFKTKNAELYNLQIESGLRIKQEVNKISREETDKLNSEIKELTGGMDHQKQIAKLYEKAEKKVRERRAQEEDINYQGMSQLKASGYSIMGGFGKMLELFTGGPSKTSYLLQMQSELAATYELENGPSVVQKKLVIGTDGKEREETDEEWSKRAFTTWEGFKDLVENSSVSFLKQAPATGTGMALTIITKNPTLGATWGGLTDTAMETDETAKQVIREGGTMAQVNMAVSQKFAAQTRLWHTYFLENALMLPEAKIKNMNDALSAFGKTYVKEVASEVFLQENNQNRDTEAAVANVMGRTYDKSYVDVLKESGFSTAVEVAATSGGMTFASTATNAYGQLKREKIMNETLNSLGKRGLASHIVNITQDLGAQAGMDMASRMNIMGQLDDSEMKNISTTIQRLAEFSTIAEETFGGDRAMQIAYVGKMGEKADLLEEKAKAQTDEKKAAIDQKIAAITTQLKDMNENKQDLVTLVNPSSNRIVYSATAEDFKNDLDKNATFRSKVGKALADAYLDLKTDNESINSFVNELAQSTIKRANWFNGFSRLVQERTQAKMQAQKDREAGKENTPTEKQIDEEFQNKINQFTKDNAVQEQTAGQVPVQPETRTSQEMEQGESQAKPQGSAQAQINVPKEVVGTRISASAENTVNALMDDNTKNAKVFKIVEDAKKLLPLLKSLFADGDIVIHTTEESFAKENNGDFESDGVFNPETKTIHINLGDPSKIENDLVVAHEITHAILLKTFGLVEKKDTSGNVLRDNTGKIIYEDNFTALNTLKDAISNVVGNRAKALNLFASNPSYNQNESAEEFLAQLGAMLSDLDTPLKQNMAQRIMSTIAEVVKFLTGKDILTNYTDQKKALEYFNYIGKKIRLGEQFDESSFVQADNGFMVPVNLSVEDIQSGNLEPGTMLGMFKRSNRLSPVLDQFTKREGTANIALDLPVATLAQKIKDHDGAVLLIMSDNTGFFIGEDGKFVAGGLGYMAIADNVKNGIGFASVNLGTVKTTMTNAAACNNGKPVLVLINVSAPQAALGNFYAAEYAFNGAQSLITSDKLNEQFKKGLIDYVTNRAELLYNFGSSADVKLAKKANAENNFQVYNAYIEKFKGIALEKFAKKIENIDFRTQQGVKTILDYLVDPKNPFSFRQRLIEGILTPTAETKTNKSTPFIKQMLSDGGFNQYDFHKKTGEPLLVEDDRLANNDWGYVVSGFTLDPSANWQDLQSKGITHPQFNAKVPGYDHFLLDGIYDTNKNFTNAMKIGAPSVAQMASQGIQPGTRTTAKGATAEERREILLSTKITKRSARSAQAQREVVGALADQFAKRLGTGYEFFYDQMGPLWRRDQTGKLFINEAKSKVETPIYAYTGIFLEMIKNDNMPLYANLMKDLFKQDEFKNLFIDNYVNEFDKENREFHRKGITEALKNKTLLNDMSGYTLPSDVLERTLLEIIGKNVAGQYDLKSGIYIALKQLWDAVNKILKGTYKINDIISEGSPIWYVSDLLANPEISFERAGVLDNFYKTAVSDKLADKSYYFDPAIASLEALPLSDGMQIVITSAGEGQIGIPTTQEQIDTIQAQRIELVKKGLRRPEFTNKIKDVYRFVSENSTASDPTLAGEEQEKLLQKAYVDGIIEIDELDIIKKLCKATLIFGENESTTDIKLALEVLSHYVGRDMIYNALINSAYGTEEFIDEVRINDNERNAANALYGVDLKPVATIKNAVFDKIKTYLSETGQSYLSYLLDDVQYTNNNGLPISAEEVAGLKKALVDFSKIPNRVNPYQNLNETSRNGTFTFMKPVEENGQKTLEPSEMIVIADINLSYVGPGKSVRIAFKEVGGNYSDLLNFGGASIGVINKVIATVTGLYPETDVRQITYSPVEDQAGKSIRLKLYNKLIQRMFGDFYLHEKSENRTVIDLPSFTAKVATGMGVEPMFNRMEEEDIDSAYSLPNKKSKRSQRTADDFEKINSDYTRFESLGQSKEQILANLFIKYGHESMRTSAFRDDFANFYDKYVSDAAVNAWSKYKLNWNTRQDGITAFVDENMLTMSIASLVEKLRKGVKFYNINEELVLESTSTALAGETAQPIGNYPTETYTFTDSEIYQSLFNMGISQKALDILFGGEFRKTIDNLVSDPLFDSTVKQGLKDDARSYKLTLTMDELAERASTLGMMDGRAIIEYLNKNLGIDNPTLPALKYLVDKINKARNLNEVGDIMNDAMNLADINDVQAISELGTFAGRVLRILKDLKKDPSVAILEQMQRDGRRYSPAFEQHIKDTSKRLNDAVATFEKSRKKFFKDFTDANGKAMFDAEQQLDKAEYEWAKIMADPRVSYRFFTEVLNAFNQRSLLGLPTVVMSAFSNAEVLNRKYNFLGGYARFITDRLLPSKVSGVNLYTQLAPFTKDNWNNLKMSFEMTHQKSWNQIKKNVKYGQMPDVQSSRFYDSAASVNVIRDAQNFTNFVKTAFQKYAGKTEFTTEEMADTLQAMMIEQESTGKLIFADGKNYSIAGSMLRAFFPTNIQGEVTARLMPLGMDRYASNAIAMRSLLDYTVLRQKMDVAGLPLGVIKELERRGSMITGRVPFVNEVPSFLPGGNAELEFRNMAMLMQAIFRGEDSPFTREGMRDTFYADNFITGGATFGNKRTAFGIKGDIVGGIRKGVRKTMMATYINALEAKSKGNKLGYTGYMTGNAVAQAANLAQGSIFPFIKVPSNIMIQLLTKINMTGASVNAVWQSLAYGQQISEFNKKYGTKMNEANTIMSSNDKDQIVQMRELMKGPQKIQFEKDLAELFSQRKRMVNAAADIPMAYTFNVVTGFIAGAGALLASDDDPDKMKMMRELQITKNDFNVSYFLDYCKAKMENRNLTPEEFFRKRGGWFINSEKAKEGQKADYYMNITNFGTYLGYGIGYAANLLNAKKLINSEANEKAEGFNQQFDAGVVYKSLFGTVFRQTPSVKTVEDLVTAMNDKSMDGKKGEQFLGNLLATSGAFLAPSLLGKPYSTGLGEVSQSGFEIETSKEDFSLGKEWLNAHLRLSRNGILFPGALRSEFYKDEIGLFGEDLSMRKTVSEPTTLSSYLESTVNFFSLRKGTMVDPGLYGEESSKHSAVRQFVIESSFLADVYRNMGGDAGQYWKIFNRFRPNSFVLTDTPDSVITGLDLDKPFKLPNDIRRDELRILGDYMFKAMQDFKDGSGRNVNEIAQLVKGAETEEEARNYIEQFFTELNTTFTTAETSYKEDFLTNRAQSIIKTMQNRGVITEGEMKILEKTYPESLTGVTIGTESPNWEPRYQDRAPRTYFEKKK